MCLILTSSGQSQSGYSEGTHQIGSFTALAKRYVRIALTAAEKNTFQRTNLT